MPLVSVARSIGLILSSSPFLPQYGDAEIARPWSKYSEGSSKHQQLSAANAAKEPKEQEGGAAAPAGGKKSAKEAAASGKEGGGEARLSPLRIRTLPSSIC